MISFCQWVHHNYITYFGVIGEPLQMIAPAHLFIQLAGGGAKGRCKSVMWMLRSSMQQPLRIMRIRMSTPWISNRPRTWLSYIWGSNLHFMSLTLFETAGNSQSSWWLLPERVWQSCLSHNTSDHWPLVVYLLCLWNILSASFVRKGQGGLVFMFNPGNSRSCSFKGECWHF